MATALEELEVLKVAEGVADEVWRLTVEWDEYAKQVIGGQLARAADSIGANIAEAFGRYHYGEKIKFLYYARGSLFETKYWLNRASSRDLMAASRAEVLGGDLNKFGRQLNTFVSRLKEQRRKSAEKPQTIAEEAGYYAASREINDWPFLTDNVLDEFSNPKDL